jgi:hypothetical protein
VILCWERYEDAPPPYVPARAFSVWLELGIVLVRVEKRTLTAKMIHCSHQSCVPVNRSTLTEDPLGLCDV